MNDIYGPSWKVYLRMLSIGSGVDSVMARICMRIGQETAGKCRKKLNTMLNNNRIDAESYVAQNDAIDQIEHLRKIGHCLVIQETPASDWIELQGGGHQRRNHGSGFRVRGD